MSSRLGLLCLLNSLKRWLACLVRPDRGLGWPSLAQLGLLESSVTGNEEKKDTVKKKKKKIAIKY